MISAVLSQLTIATLILIAVLINPINGAEENDTETSGQTFLPLKPINLPPIFCLDANASSCFPRPPRCRCDQVYLRCGPPCQRTCSSTRFPSLCRSRNQLATCRPGCYCRDYLVLSDDGSKCIPPSQCPVCGVNEVYRPIGSHCIRTCDCLETCHSTETRAGCYCKAGYVLNNFGQCVRPINCPLVK